jgi:plasmid stability protein
MRTTIDLPDDLVGELKRRAARSKQSFKAVVEDALRQALATRVRKAAPPFRAITFGEGGLQPGIDLDDTAALIDAMER